MTLAIGVIGTGVMGAEHARLLRDEVRGGRLAAVCDIDAVRAADIAKGAQVFDKPAELIASPDVDAVVIASPDATHAEMARICLDAGKPVLCEKPLASTAAAALQMVEAEVEIGRRLISVGYMRRFDPSYVEMKHRLDSGTFGAPVLLHNTHRNASAPEWFTGAMAITNSFVHEIDISRWILGTEMVTAQVHAGPGGDPLLITMVTDAGQIVSTEVTMHAVYGYHVHAEVLCREGAVSMAAPTRLVFDHAQLHGHDWPLNWVPRFAEAYRLQMTAWVSAVRSGRSTGASAWDGYAASAIAERIVPALQSGQQVALNLGVRPNLYRD